MTCWALHTLPLPNSLTLPRITPPLPCLLSISGSQKSHFCLWASTLVFLLFPGSSCGCWLPRIYHPSLTLNTSFSEGFFPDHIISRISLLLLLLPCPQSMFMTPLCFIFCRALTTSWSTLHFCLSHPTRMQVLHEQDLFCSLLISSTYNSALHMVSNQKIFYIGTDA